MTHHHDHEGHEHHHHEEEDQLIHLIDEEGNEIAYEIVKAFVHEGTEYVVLYQADGSTGDFALIFKVTEEEGDEATFETLSDEEFAMIEPIYNELMDEDEDENE